MGNHLRKNVSRSGTAGKWADGRSFVRFERYLAQSVEQVWAAITEPVQLAQWFPGLEFERRRGGAFRMTFAGECDGPAQVEGEVVAYDPPNVLQLGTMRWELSSTPDGACMLVFTDVLVFDGPRSEARVTDSVLGGWHRYLDLLEDAAAGRPVDLSRPEPDYAGRE